MDFVMMLCGCSVVEFFTGRGIFRCGKIIEMAELLSRNDNFLLFLNIAIFWFGEGVVYLIFKNSNLLVECVFGALKVLLLLI
jgi:hypothetical protein